MRNPMSWTPFWTHFWVSTISSWDYSGIEKIFLLVSRKPNSVNFWWKMFRNPLFHSCQKTYVFKNACFPHNFKWNCLKIFFIYIYWNRLMWFSHRCSFYWYWKEDSFLVCVMLKLPATNFTPPRVTPAGKITFKIAWLPLAWNLFKLQRKDTFIDRFLFSFLTSDCAVFTLWPMRHTACGAVIQPINRHRPTYIRHYVTRNSEWNSGVCRDTISSSSRSETAMRHKGKRQVRLQKQTHTPYFLLQVITYMKVDGEIL